MLRSSSSLQTGLKMSDSVKEEPKTADNRHRSKTIHVAVRSSAESRDFTVRGDCTVKQLRWALSERLRAPAEQLVLIHFGRVLREAELLRHLKEQNGSISLCMIRRPQPLCSQASNNSSSETFKSEHTAVPDPDHTLIPTPTSPCCLVEGVESIDLENNGPGFFSAVQLQMENQLLGDPEMMRHVLGSPFVQSNLSNSGPQLTRQLILSNPQIQQPLQTNPEVLELFRNPDMIEELMQNEDGALDNLPSEQGNPKITSASSGILQEKQRNKTPVVSTSSGNPLTLEAQSNLMPSPSSDSADPLRELTATPRADLGSQSTITAGMQSLLEEITASPGLMESLLSGPYVSSLLNCLSRNPDLAEQMLLSHPLFSGNPQLQQQMRQQIPLFLQQMQSPELLSAMLNPRAMKALLQIQQGLQTLAAETLSLTPATGLGTSGSSVNEASDLHCESTPNNQPGTRLQAATVTEQQQQFVHQMLQALANTNNEVRHEEDEFKEELEQLNSMGFSDRRANLEALISTGGDLSTAIQHLLSL